jgi:hypothetical protein
MMLVLSEAYVWAAGARRSPTSYVSDKRIGIRRIPVTRT